MIYLHTGPNQLIFDYEDLFEEFGKYKYFKIILTNYEDDISVINREWCFGNEFFKNNIVTFNNKRKDITIYADKKEIKTKNNNYLKNKKEIIYPIIIVFLGFIVYILIKTI